MRSAFIQRLTHLAARDDRVVLLTGDLGFMVVEPFAEAFPERFFNVGVAEQNMVGVATGMAEAGLRPYVYSIATFASLRPYEFVRDGPVLHQLPVSIVGVGGGFEYGPAGSTHHAVEDIGVMRMLTGLTVVAPADHAQAVAALDACHAGPGPVYYRLGKNEVSTVGGLDGRFRLGRIERVRDGSEVVLLTTGSVSLAVGPAVDLLVASGLDPAVAVVASVSPPPTADLIELLSGARLAVTIENHGITGGLGSLLAEVIADSGLGTSLLRLGITGPLAGEVGTESYLNGRHGLNFEGIARAVLAASTPSES